MWARAVIPSWPPLYAPLPHMDNFMPVPGKEITRGGMSGHIESIGEVQSWNILYKVDSTIVTCISQ